MYVDTMGIENDNFSFFKNLLLVGIFLTITPLTILVSLFSLVSLSTTKTTQDKIMTSASLVEFPKSGVSIFASLPANSPEISEAIASKDARPEIIKQYLIKFQSPLVPYANLLVERADYYQLDFRLLTAIAQQESNLCKIIPLESYNCWGWGITGSSTLYFDSYEEAIDTVSRGLKKNYIDKGLTTPETIMKKYTPPSSGSWAFGVSSFMADLQ